MLKLVSKGMIEWTQSKSRLGDTSGYLVGSWMFLWMKRYIFKNANIHMIKCEPEQEFRSGLDKVNGLDERQ